MSFINSQSFRCLLGVQSKNVDIFDGLFCWQVGKTKRHFTIGTPLTPDHIDVLKQRGPSNFHYISPENLDVLKQHFTVDKAKHVSVILDIQDLAFTGNKGKSVRHCLNRCKKENLILETQFRSTDDVKKMIEEWSNDYTDKYFRDNSGKNLFFYKNGFHRDLTSLFVYHENDLVAFGTLSSPVDGYCSYILGKALFKRHYGLSEFADVELYKLGQKSGAKYVNMGAAVKGLLDYKTKFPHSVETHFDGKIA